MISWAVVQVSATLCYGSATTSIEFFSPTRYQWDNEYFRVDKDQVQELHADSMNYNEAWSTLPLRLPFYNYIGLNSRNTRQVRHWSSPTRVQQHFYDFSTSVRRKVLVNPNALFMIFIPTPRKYWLKGVLGEFNAIRYILKNFINSKKCVGVDQHFPTHRC